MIPGFGVAVFRAQFGGGPVGPYPAAGETRRAGSRLGRVDAARTRDVPAPPVRTPGR